MPAGVTGFRIVDELTDADYGDVLAPGLRAAAAAGDVRLLLAAAKGFDLVTLKSRFEELRNDPELDLGNSKEWRRVAIVADANFIFRAAFPAFAKLVPGRDQALRHRRRGRREVLGRRLVASSDAGDVPRDQRGGEAVGEGEWRPERPVAFGGHREAACRPASARPRGGSPAPSPARPTSGRGRPRGSRRRSAGRRGGRPSRRRRPRPPAHPAPRRPRRRATTRASGAGRAISDQTAVGDASIVTVSNPSIYRRYPRPTGC